MQNEVKEPAPKYNYVSPDEYLAMERASEERHEYYDGYVVAMSGASLEHNQIAMNLYSKIGTYLEGKECQMLPSDMRVSTPNRDAYMYPDGTIVCGEPHLEDDKFDTLLNPSVIFEILSPSTSHHDKGHKFLHYQQIPSLKEFMIIETRKRFIQIIRKQEDGAWRITEVNEPVSEIHIQVINFNISMDDLYRNTGL